MWSLKKQKSKLLPWDGEAVGRMEEHEVCRALTKTFQHKMFDQHLRNNHHLHGCHRWGPPPRALVPHPHTFRAVTCLWLPEGL